MAHQSWYRKYRPQTFDDVVGQAHVERTLRNAVDEGAVAHAYLFTGPRGTGKTTTARLLAKALNCQTGPTGQPDDTCEDCRAIAEGTHPDVYELDAASRTGVDNVREEIIGRVNFAPARGRYKVYIIDEVHMLSASAFNALLKTLEEPPPHAVFVLCTTHPHKVPETIHSRCQRFEFRRLSVEEIAARLRRIADAEGVEVEDSALALIARHASGGMRDAITTLEQLASFAAGTITLADAESLLGEVGSDELFALVDLVVAGDLGGIFGFVAELVERGADLVDFSLALARHARDLFVSDLLEDPGPALDVRAEELRRLRRQAQAVGRARLARMLDLLDDLTGTMRSAADARLALEFALTRLARPETDLTLEALAQRVEALEDALRSGLAQGRRTRQEADAASAPDAEASDGGSRRRREAADAGSAKAERAAAGRKAASAPESVAEPEPASAVQHADESASPLDARSVKRLWPAVIAEMRKRKPSRSYHFDSTEPEVVDGVLVVEFPRDRSVSLDMARDPDTVALLRNALERVLGASPPIEYRLGRQGVSSSVAAGQEGPTPAAASADPSPGGAEEGAKPQAGSSGAAFEDVEARLIAELGAAVVEERVVGDGSEGAGA